MSHFSRIKTRIVEIDLLLQALRDLGLQFEEGAQKVRGFGGQTQPVDVRVKLPLSYDIGFKKNGDSFEIVADWYGVRGLKQQDFVQRLTQRYAYHAARAKLEAQGFNLVEEETQESGQIRLVLRRMA